MRLLLALVLTFAMSVSYGNNLAPVRNAELASVLAFQSVLAEKQFGSHSIKIILAPYTWGECWGTVKSCPNLRLFISVVPDGLNEKSRLYKLPSAKAWAFGEWETSQSDENSESESIGFTVQTTLPEANIEANERKKFKPILYRVRIYRKGATIEVQSDIGRNN